MLLIPLLILIFFLGLEVTVILKIEAGLPERLSLSFLLGIGLLTFAVFLLAYVFNLNFGLANTFAVLTSLCVIFFILKFRGIISFFKNIKFKKIAIKPKIAIFWGFILAIFAYTLLVNSFWPITDWDALALYDFRAKAFLIDTNLIHATASNGYFLGYPLLTSLGHLFVYQTGLNNPKFIYSLFYLSFIIIFYYSLRKIVDEDKTIIFTTILVLMPEIFNHATMAYTNLPYTIYLVLGSIYLYLGLKNKDFGFFIVSSIFIGLSTWTRSAEPFWLSPLIVAVIFSVLKRQWLWPFAYTAILAGFIFPWRFLQSMFGKGVANVVGQVVTTSGLVVQNLQLSILKPVFDFMMANVVMAYLGYFILLVIILFIKFSIRSKEWIFTLLLLFNLGLTFAGTMVFAKNMPHWQDIPDSLTRMVMFIPPMMIFLFAESIGELFNKYKK